MLKKTNIAIALFSVAALLVMSFKPDSSGGKAGYSGAPNEGTCANANCHAGTPNTGNGSILIGSNIPSSGYVAGTVYQMTVTVAQAQMPLFGFDLTALNSAGTNAGTLAVTNAAETQILVSGGRNNMTHKSGAGASTSGSKTFSFNWTAPAVSVGVVSFYAAGNAADGTGGTGGDNIYTTSKTFSPATVAPAVISITGNTIICAGMCTSLTASASPTGNYTYTWSNSPTITGATTQICPTASGTYTVTATLSGAITTQSVTITVNPLPLPTATGSSAICAGATAQIGVGSATGATFASYFWNTQATTQIINVSPTATTTYTATVTDANGCAASTTRTITVNTRPLPVISGSDVVCLGQTAQIGVGTTAGGTFTSYQWSTQATTPTIATTPTATTTYTVTVTDANGCTASATRMITVNPLPTVALTQSGSLCTGAVALTATGGNTYAWSIVGASGATASVTAAGAYIVTATSTSGCAKSASITVVACTPTSIVFTGNTTPCVGLCTAITASIPNNTSVLTYTWSNNLGTGATKQICLTVPPTATVYTVTATNANGVVVGSGSVTVSPAATTAATITGTATICAGTSTTLSANPNTTGFTYLWNNTVTTRNVTVLPTANTIYTCTVTNLSGCTSSASFGVTVNAAPIITITRGAALCGNNATTLTATGTAGTNNTFLWSTAATSSVITVTSPSTYTVTVTNAAGCTASKTFTLTQSTPPSFTLTETGTLCSPNGMTLTATAAAGTTNTYLWSTQATGSMISFISAGVYSVTATNSAGCTATRSFTATQPTPPTAAIAQSGTLCSPNGVLLTATGGTSYEWSTGSLIATSNVQTAGIYTVYVTNAAGCTASATTNVTACANITVAITGDNRVCAAATPGTTGGCTLLTATATGTATAYTYIWSSQATTAAFNTCPTTTTTYTVTATASTGATATASWTVAVNPAPVITITQSAALCGNNATTLTATGGGTYSWGAISGSALLTVTAANTYTVTVTTPLGCTATKSITLTQATVPTLAITQTGTLCTPNGVNLVVSTGFATYAWSNNITTPTNNVQAAATYTVTATAQNGCSRSSSVTVAPCASIAVSIAGEARLCANPTTATCTALTATASGAAAPATYTYAWSNQMTSAVAQVCLTATNTYTVTATASTGATATASFTITLNPRPAVTFTGNTTLTCSAPIATITAVSSIPNSTFAWGSSSSNVLSVTVIGTYIVTVSAPTGCTTTQSVAVTSNFMPPTATLTSAGNLTCSRVSTLLTASTNGIVGNYLWSNAATTASITVTAPATYTVTITNPANGCTTTATVAVTRNVTAPIIAVSGGLEFCAGGVTTLTATASNGSATFMWNAAVTSPTITTQTGGTYTVTATNTTNGCTATKSATVVSKPRPVVTITQPNITCAGIATYLQATGGGTYLWNTQVTTAAVTIAPSTTVPATYTVTVTGANACTATATKIPQYLSGTGCTPIGGGGGTRTVAASVEHILLYPNPTENNFNLVFGEQDWLDATITVTDVAGKTITTIRKTFIVAGEIMVFETSNWVSGVYFITIENKIKRQSLKVVKIQ